MVHNDSNDLLAERKDDEKRRTEQKHEEEDCFRNELAKKNGNWKNCLSPNGKPATHIRGPNPSIDWNPPNNSTRYVVIHADEFVVNGGNHNNLLDTIWLYEKKHRGNAPEIYWILEEKCNEYAKSNYFNWAKGSGTLRFHSRCKYLPFGASNCYCDKR